MASWEPTLIEAATKAVGQNPIENIDHDAKVIELKAAVIEPSILRSIERVVEQLGIGYRVEQLT